MLNIKAGPRNSWNYRKLLSGCPVGIIQVVSVIARAMQSKYQLNKKMMKKMIRVVKNIQRPHLWFERQVGAMRRLRDFRHRKILRLMITGTKGKTTTTTMLARIMAEAGHRVGYCTTDHVVIEGKVIHSGDSAGQKGARLVLNAPAVNSRFAHF